MENRQKSHNLAASQVEFIFLSTFIIYDLQGLPVNQAFWQQCFSIFSMSGEGE